MTYVRSDILYHRRTDVKVNNDAFQSFCVELCINKEKWMMCNLYRPPASPVHSYSEALYFVTDRMLKVTDMVILMGDTNVNLLKEPQASAVQDNLTSYSLLQLVKTATCFKGQPSSLGHVHTNKPHHFAGVINYDCGLSDFHNCVVIFTKLTFPKRPPQVKLYGSYKKFDEKSLSKDMSSTLKKKKVFRGEILNLEVLGGEIRMELKISNKRL